MDGNMKQVHLNVSSVAHDPGLNNSRAYFHNPSAHKVHVELFDKRFPNEHSTCNDHKAISDVSTSKLANLTVTGIVSVFCGHHDTFRPDGTTDLRVGERYVYHGLFVEVVTETSYRQVNVDFAYLGQLHYRATTLQDTGFDHKWL